MSEKLTVAELLARAQQEGKTRSDRPRRRRRSLDEGGISVSELTGSIPVVKDRTAATHSSGEERSAGLVDEKQDTAVAEPAAAEPTVAEPTAAPESEVAEPQASEPTFEPEAVPETELASEPEPTPVVEPEPEAAADNVAPAVESKAPEAPVTPADAHPRTDSIPFVIPSAPREVDVDHATGDITFSFEAVTAADPEMPPFAAPSETEAFPAVVEPTGQPQQAMAPGYAPDEAFTEEGLADEHLAEESLADEELADGDFEDEYDEAYDDEDDEYDVDEDDEDDAISWPVLIVEVIVGLAIGAGIFLGFEKLWATAPVWLVVALAIAVIILLLAVVQVLRRERDVLTMLMAVAAGAAITFGPALLS